jgi:hypothetical protein
VYGELMVKLLREADDAEPVAIALDRSFEHCVGQISTKSYQLYKAVPPNMTVTAAS